MVKWLSIPKHSDHTAKSNGNDWYNPCRAFAYVLDGILVGVLFKRGKLPVRCSPPPLCNWTIYRADGKPVKFKRKQKTLVVGRLDSGERLMSIDSLGIRFSMHACRSRRGYEVLIRERKP